MSYIDPDLDYSNITLRVGTDCSGIDTPLLALKLLNINVIHKWSCEIDIFAKQQLLLNHSPEYFYDDIFTRDVNTLPDVDLYIAGCPCQSFSSAGLKQGLGCKNGLIFLEVIKVIKHKQPTYFIIENVKALLDKNNSEAFKIIKTELNDLKDYTINYEVLNTKDFGVPQHRRRLYIIGVKNSKPITIRKPVIETNILDYLDTSLPSNKEKCLIPRRQLVLNDVIRKKGIDLNDNWIITVGSSISFARSYQDLCPCITCFCNYYYITSQERFLSIKELYTLQGFPQTYMIKDITNRKHYKLIGNAMSLNVLYFIFVSLFKIN